MGTTLDYSPASWHVVANGASIDAEHRVTREKFSGTVDAFNAMVKAKGYEGLDAIDSIIENPRKVPVTALPSSGGVEFDEATTEAIVAIAGDASSGSAAQIVDGYPVEVTGTSEVLVSAVPCDVVWIAHNGAAGTITLRDAATTGSGLAAAKTVDMATEQTMQAGALRTQYGVTATLTAGKATFWVRPL